MELDDFELGERESNGAVGTRMMMQCSVQGPDCDAWCANAWQMGWRGIRRERDLNKNKRRVGAPDMEHFGSRRCGEFDGGWESEKLCAIGK